MASLMQNCTQTSEKRKAFLGKKEKESYNNLVE